MKRLIPELERSLKAGQFERGIELARSWLAAAESGEPETLLAECSEQVRPRIALLMRDLLSGYPEVLLGCPVLIHATPELELDSPSPPHMLLPRPRGGTERPCADLKFLGWLPATAHLPAPQPFRHENFSDLPWFTPTALVALFRAGAEAMDAHSLDLPAAWWGRLFAGTPGNVCLTGSLMLPYPDALEAAAAMQAAARAEPAPERTFFLTETDWAREEGREFQAMYRCAD